MFDLRETRDEKIERLERSLGSAYDSINKLESKIYRLEDYLDIEEVTRDSNAGTSRFNWSRIRYEKRPKTKKDNK